MGQNDERLAHLESNQLWLRRLIIGTASTGLIFAGFLYKTVTNWQAETWAVLAEAERQHEQAVNQQYVEQAETNQQVAVALGKVSTTLDYILDRVERLEDEK